MHPVETAYLWHSGMWSALYSFASLGGVLFSEDMRSSLIDEIEDCLFWVRGNPEHYPEDEEENLLELLRVAQTTPAKHSA